MSFLDKFSDIEAGSFLSGKDFEVAGGEVVELSGEPTPIDQKEDTPEMYKTKEGNPLVKSGHIKVLQQMRYTFKKDGEETFFDNASWGFLKSLINLAPKAGEKFTITRSGEGTGTKYSMVLVADEDTVITDF